MREDVAKVSSGVIGNSIAVNTTVCQVTAANLGPGRYKVWGASRHTLEDGLKLIVGAALVIARIPQTATQTVQFGPLMVDVLLATDNIILQLAVATGAADTASGALYVQKLSQ